jgi:hypothetical protein
MARNNTDAKKSFVLYVSFWKHISGLDDHQLAQLTRAIFARAMDAEEPDMDGVTQMAFSFISDQMDRDREAYEETCRRRREGGAKGGRPTEKPKGSSENLKVNSETSRLISKPIKPDNDDDNDTDDDNEDDDVNDNEAWAQALAAISTGASKHRTKFSNFPERTYTNFDELERLLLNAD